MGDTGPAVEHAAPSQALAGTPLPDEGSHPSQEVFPVRTAGMRLGEWIVRIAGSYALVGGLISLLGWVLEIPQFKDWTGSGITMKANAAFCAMMGGAALWLSLWSKGKVLLRICAGVVLLIGWLTLLQHISGWNFGIDTLFFAEARGSAATAAPGRMGPPAST